MSSMLASAEQMRVESDLVQERKTRRPLPSPKIQRFAWPSASPWSLLLTATIPVLNQIERNGSLQPRANHHPVACIRRHARAQGLFLFYLVRWRRRQASEQEDPLAARSDALSYASLAFHSQISH